MKIQILVRRGLLAASLVVAGGGVVALGAAPAGASPKQVTTAGSFTTYQMMHNIFGPSLHDLTPGYDTAAQHVPATATYCATGVNFTTTHTDLVPTTNHVGAPNGSTAGKKYLWGEQSAAANKKACVTFTRSSSPPTSGASSTVKTTTHFDYYAYALDGVAPMVGKNAGGSRENPITLTLYDMKQIYLCKSGYTNWKTVTGATATKTVATPTHSVNNTTQGGQTAPIVRFWPQTGSGTRSVYTAMLGFTPDKVTKGTGTHHSTCTTQPTTTFKTVTVHTVTVTGTKETVKQNVVNEENTEDGIIYDSSLAGHATYIKDAVFIYSSGKFEQEWNQPSLYNETNKNHINNTAIGNFNAGTLYLAQMRNTKKPSSTGPFANFGAQSGTFTPTTNRGTLAINTSVVKEANEWFSHITTSSKGQTSSSSPVAGVRYVYNVADTVLPTYSEAKMMIGFDNRPTGAKSALCHGDDSAAITASGFVPLNSGATAPANSGGGGTTAKFGGTSDKAGAYCREFPGHSYPSFGGRFDWTTSTYIQAT